MVIIAQTDDLRQQVEALEAKVRDLMNLVHPKYGPCDALGLNGTCSECEKIRKEHHLADWVFPINGGGERQKSQVRNQKKTIGGVRVK